MILETENHSILFWFPGIYIINIGIEATIHRDFALRTEQKFKLKNKN